VEDFQTLAVPTVKFGGEGRNRPYFPAVALQICLILLAIQAKTVLLSCNFQSWERVCEQSWNGSEHGAMEEHDGFGFAVGRVAEVIEVTVGPQAADDRAARWGIEAVAVGAGGDFTVVPDANTGLLTPDEGPPGTGGNRLEGRAFFGQGLLAGGVWGGAQFAVDFVLVDVREELVEEAVGADDLKDVVGGQEGRQAFLPVVVTAFDFAFGLGGGGIKEGDAVEVEGGPELGEGIGIVGVEEGVVVHIEGQRQAVGLKDPWQEVEVGQEGFVGIEACAGVVAGGIVEQVEEGLFIGGAGEPGVRTDVVLPEGAVVAGLPAFDGFGGGLIAGVRSELVFESPAADAGAGGGKAQAAVQFTGGSAVGGRRLGREEFGEQCADFAGPGGLMIATRKTWGPVGRVALGASAQVIGAQLVETAQADAQFGGDGLGGQFTDTGLGQEMPDEG